MKEHEHRLRPLKWAQLRRYTIFLRESYKAKNFEIIKFDDPLISLSDTRLRTRVDDRVKEGLNLGLDQRKRTARLRPGRQ